MGEGRSLWTLPLRSERCLALSRHLGDLLFDRLGLFFQTLQVPFETGDLFLFGPEAPPAVEGCATAAKVTMMVPAPAATTVVTVMMLVSAVHVLTSLLYKSVHLY
jgi:hypothetical protein